MQLISTFVFAYYLNSRFSHDAAQIIQNIFSYQQTANFIPHNRKVSKVHIQEHDLRQSNRVYMILCCKIFLTFSIQSKTPEEEQSKCFSSQNFDFQKQKRLKQFCRTGFFFLVPVIRRMAASTQTKDFHQQHDTFQFDCFPASIYHIHVA